MKDADIVVTNPPFSLIKDFLSLVEKKEFIVIAPKNVLTYNLGQTLMKKQKLFLGYTIGSNHLSFVSPTGENMFVPCSWYVSFYTPKKPLILTKTYSADKYPVLDNIDAINVDKTADIPIDYDGLMAVPITFYGKYCHEQFEIVGGWKPVLNGKNLYYRLLIKHKKGEH